MLIDDDSKVDSLKFEILLLWQSASSLLLLLFSLDIISKSLFWLFDKFSLLSRIILSNNTEDSTKVKSKKSSLLTIPSFSFWFNICG